MIKIQIIKNGPAIISTDTDEKIVFEGTDLRPGFNNNPIALCRCGKSANKVYCDGNHSKKIQNENLIEDLKKSEIM